MRTTISLDADVARALDQLRRERGLGLSDAVNELVRIGLTAKPARPRFRQRAQSLGLRIDVSNVAEALEELEGPGAR